MGLPGGHIDKGETPDESLHREVMEEAYVEGTCEQLGFIIVDHSNNAKWNDQSKYPKVGFQLFHTLQINKMHTFEAGFESCERILVDPTEISRLYNGWHHIYQEILDCALSSPNH
ncbi:NUDIX hydrolase [Alkalicoccobacillus plakortidis]|uniref:NUDIX domain-containing protein n=1 Tax=Alkalicoccobacillus plakortidis TaxID=444060 RepID=A0ABT0XNT5_9BACI|nr:NUDIX domain-containing protein [Alkalicoccobacillus plakortidis]MCM2677497.1 NUDIX domain-containing protein [Alkalicoccobacillus plakortidis]